MSGATWIQIIRDLADAAMIDTRARMREEVKARAHKAAEDRVVEALAGKDAREQTREMFRGKLKRGELDDTMIEIEVRTIPPPPCRHARPCRGMETQMQDLRTCSRPLAAAGAAQG
jgi:ATP-dependent HslUV protease ATP-binding subunit HslU